MKKILLFMIFVFLSTCVTASIEVNSTIIQSLGLNTNITVSYPMLLDQFAISNSTISFYNITQSTTQTSSNYSISFNITEGNASYTGQMLPYVKLQSSNIAIISNLAEDINVSFYLYGYNCTSRVFNYYSASDTYNRDYTEAQYSCSGDTMQIEVRLEQGTNILGFKERKFVSLIDETTNAPLNLSQVDSAILYYDDNSTLFNFKTANTTEVNFTNLQNNKLRLEIGYSDGGFITRYIDVDLLDLDVPICANHEGVTHYEQLITSSTEKAVVLKSVFANCLIVADYTRFAYQNSKVLKAYTIHKTYYLYTFSSSGVQTYLASVDGTIASYINLDTLEFDNQGYNFNIVKDAIAIQKTGDDQVLIYYADDAGDNADLDLTISRMDTGAEVLNVDDFTDPNEFSMYFDTSTLSGVNDTTVYKLELTITGEDESTDTITKYFNLQGSSGVLSSGVAFVISLLLVIFGLSLTSSEYTFSWFGIFVMVAAIGLLALSVQSWYNTLLMGMEFIILVYIGLSTVGKTPQNLG